MSVSAKNGLVRLKKESNTFIKLAVPPLGGMVSFVLQSGFGLKCRRDRDKTSPKMPISLSYRTSQVKNCENQ